MFSKEIYIARRAQLAKKIETGILLFMGNREVGMNCSANVYPFRQDSNFLYYFGIDQPGLAAIIDLDEGKEFLFGDDLSPEDIVWVGVHPSIAALAERTGLQQSKAFSDLDTYLKSARESGRLIHFLPPYRFHNMSLLRQWLNIPTGNLGDNTSEVFIKAIIEQRSIKSEEEIEELDKAATISNHMHIAAMKATAPGKTEAHITGIIKGIATGMNGDTAYPAIFTKNGQILHNHHHDNTLRPGDLVLGDFGAETSMHYAGDLTRTYPADKQFSEQQKEIYEIVLQAFEKSLKACKPGTPYKEIHLLAAEVIAGGLKEAGLMKGDVKEAVAAGAHALFFPHGLGHLIGLDVHDMEDLGEDLVGYNQEIQRSDQFGTANLRLGRKLEAGFAITVEPGIYFIPQLIDSWKADKKYSDFINYESLENYRDFGGIRIEDDILITKDASRLLGKNTAPKTIAGIEDLRH